MNEIIYCLVLERKPGDYNAVECSELDICKEANLAVGNDLLSIDIFTSRFTEQEIRKSIENSNMPRSEYCDFPLVIYGLAKHGDSLKRVQCFPIASKNTMTVINDYRMSNVKFNAHENNKLFGEFNKIVHKLYHDEAIIKRLLEEFKIALKENNKEKIFSLIDEVAKDNYSKARELYFTIYNLEVLRRQNSVIDIEDNLENTRTLKKLEDVA